jgi:hypothetical protein
MSFEEERSQETNVDYNEISEKFLGKNVTQAAKDAALDVPIKKNEDEWSPEAREAAAEARKKKEGPKTEAATKRAESKENRERQAAAWSREQERVRVKHGMGRNEEGGLR